MNLNQFYKKEVSIEHFDGCPAFTEMTMIGFTNRLYRTKLPSYKVNLVYFKDREGDYITLVSDQDRIGKYIIKEFIKDKRIIKNLYKKWLKNFDLMMKNYYKLFTQDLTILKDNELIKWSDDLHKFYRKVSMPGFIDGFMFYADKRLDYLLKEFCFKNNIPDYPKIFSILTAPTKLSFLSEEERDLIKLIRFLKRLGYKSDGDLKKFLNKLNKKQRTKVTRLLKEHLFKYSWIRSSYVGYKEYSYQDLENEIKRIVLKNIHDPRNICEKNKKVKNKLILKYTFSQEIRAISDLTEILGKWQDQRKVYTLTFVSLKEKLLQEVAKRTKIDLELLRYSLSKELKDVLKGKLKKNELKKRQRGCLFLYQNGRNRAIITDKEAKKIFEKISRLDLKEVKTIKGRSASLGYARGIVKIIKSVKEIKKIQQGNILVAPMTRPEHIPGMRKSSAVVTDEGGITCHAAIVSRELKIPCIIGTKIATKVLKDGDLVEVDANKGVVKIIK